MRKSVIQKFTTPRDLLKAWLTEHKLNQAWLSRCMERPEKTISEIMTGKTRITAQTGLELEKVTSIKALYWLQLQIKVDLNNAL